MPCKCALSSDENTPLTASDCVSVSAGGMLCLCVVPLIESNCGVQASVVSHSVFLSKVHMESKKYWKLKVKIFRPGKSWKIAVVLQNSGQNILVAWLADKNWPFYQKHYFGPGKHCKCSLVQGVLEKRAGNKLWLLVISVSWYFVKWCVRLWVYRVWQKKCLKFLAAFSATVWNFNLKFYRFIY